jgi:hypothetical protein
MIILRCSINLPNSVSGLYVIPMKIWIQKVLDSGLCRNDGPVSE